jgi:hypothetical protein
MTVDPLGSLRAAAAGLDAALGDSAIGYPELRAKARHLVACAYAVLAEDRLTGPAARELIGGRVTYHPAGLPAEEGTITAVNGQFVFVLFDGDTYSKATRPEDLKVNPAPTPPRPSTRG